MPRVEPYEALLDRFVDHLRAVRNLAPSTASNSRHYVACFLRCWLDHHPGQGLERIRAASTSTPPPRPQPSSATLTDLRGRQRHAIIATLRWTGVRAGALSNLQRDRVDLPARRLEVLGKGSRRRIVAMPAPLAEVLGVFLHDVRPQLPDTPYRFVNTHPFVPDADRRCSVSALQRECRLAAQGAGLPRPALPTPVAVLVGHRAHPSRRGRGPGATRARPPQRGVDDALHAPRRRGRTAMPRRAMNGAQRGHSDAHCSR